MGPYIFHPQMKFAQMFVVPGAHVSPMRWTSLMKVRLVICVEPAFREPEDGE